MDDPVLGDIYKGRTDRVPEMTVARSAREALGPMTVPKASEVLAGELRERILTGQFRPGASLPSERDLGLQTQMSRSTVREALRMLEVQGLLEIRAGRGGGAFVRRPGSDAVASSVELFVRGRQVGLSALLETREAIEPSCAALAAARRTGRDLARLDESNDAIDRDRSDLRAFLTENVHWHLLVAEASHNELLLAFMRSIAQPIHTATANEEFVDAEVRATAVRAHVAVTEAIRAGDVDAASRRMQRHVHGYATAVLQVETRAGIELADDGAGTTPATGRRSKPKR